ncbi:3-isopropylmalate dehydratase small subunit, partial [candidate division WOR-3 bacterium]|nr:3-isopropylmalate dehydratase small subunit [candidate division WOR-3 bacterium]
MIEKVKGRVIKLGDNIDTDVIYPGRYLPIIDAEEMGLHALEGLDPDFPSKIKKGDIIIAGKNFGCGSSREQAATCLKSAGISAVVAKSFSRIFFRNGINQGIPIVVSDEAPDRVNDGDEVEIDFSTGEIKLSEGETISFKEFPDFIFSILDAGGLIPYVKNKL